MAPEKDRVGNPNSVTGMPASEELTVLSCRIFLCSIPRSLEAAVDEKMIGKHCYVLPNIACWPEARLYSRASLLSNRVFRR